MRISCGSDFGPTKRTLITLFALVSLSDCTKIGPPPDAAIQTAIMKVVSTDWHYFRTPNSSNAVIGFKQGINKNNVLALKIKNSYERQVNGEGTYFFNVQLTTETVAAG
jgi:hypothetical protein